MSNLRTYEMDILSQGNSNKNDKNDKNDKNVAFLTEGCESVDENEEMDDEAIAMITRNFSKILKLINRRNRGRKHKQIDQAFLWIDLKTYRKIHKP